MDYKTIALGLIVSGMSMQALALEPAGVALGSGVALFPKLRLGYEQNTNLYQRINNEVAAGRFNINPSLTLVRDTGQTFMQASYDLDKGLYSIDKKKNDYLDHHFNAELQTEFNSFNRFDAAVSYALTHDTHGSGILSGTDSPNANEQERYKQANAELGYGLGTQDAFVNVRAYLKHYNKKYDDLDILNIETRSHYKNTAGMSLRLTPGARSGVVGDVSYTQIRYFEDKPFGNKHEGANLRVQAGFAWKMSSITKGEVQIGAAKRTFTYDNFDNSKFRPVWQAKLTWQPQESTELTAFTGSENTETNASGSHVQQSTAGASLAHRFSVYFATKLSVEYQKNHTMQVSGVKKELEDDSLKLKGALIYSPLTWLDVQLYAGHDAYNTDDKKDYALSVYGLVLDMAI